MNQDLLDSIYDIIIDLKGKELSNDKIEIITKNIPINILKIGIEWGYYDTEFRDKVFIWLKENNRIIDELL